MSTALDVDLAALVGEMEAPPCESRGHATERPHDDGPATHYVRIDCPGCPEPVVKSYCLTFTRRITVDNPFVDCGQCGYVYRAHEVMTVLGPVKS